MEARIQKSFHYDDFKRIKGNRIVNPSHLARLRKSIAKKNLLHLNPIIVNEKMEVIDGQHRLTVCKHLGLPVYYIVGKGLSFNDIVQMNSNVSDWGIGDYLESYCEQGYDDYITVKSFAQKWGLSTSNAIAILTMSGTVTRAGYKAFKEGEFEIIDLKASEKFVERLKEIAPFTTRNTWKDRDFIRALSTAYSKGIDADRLLAEIGQSKNPLHRRGNVTEYLRQFEDIYNTNLQNRVRLY